MESGSPHIKFELVREEALESVMCEVIKIQLKKRITTRSWRENQPLNIITAVERQILKLGLPLFYFSLQSYFYDVTHDTFQHFIREPLRSLVFMFPLIRRQNGI